MTTSLYIDEGTKKRATQKAKNDQLSFSAVVRILLSDYAAGKIVIGARSVPHYQVENIIVEEKTQAKMDGIVEKWRNKKN